jgi:acetyl-CoA carboxylase biotin carboxylase subunit
MFHKVLVANRGAAAARVIRALRKLGVRSVAVYSEADRDAPYLAEADERFAIGPAPARASYLNQDTLVGVARQAGADAVHPGYGFLSENATFARRLADEGVAFIGPAAQWIDAMGHKTRARALMHEKGLPVGLGSGVLPADESELIAAARRIGFPVLIKPAAGGGGIGMLPAENEAVLIKAAERARSLAQRGFANDEIYLERLLVRPRHIEFQIVADRHGNARALFERDCSVQRRHQKVIEEAPAPGLPRAEAEGLAGRFAETLGGLGYDNIGTVEMLRGADGEYQFMEMNTRLQVEHGITEAITGVDIVALQIRTAAGERLDDCLPAHVAINGHAVEARVYAEDPDRFLPSPGPLNVYRPPSGEGIRVETGYAEGGAVTPYYDPMIAKVIAWGEDRSKAIARLGDALQRFAIEGVKTNIPALLRVLAAEDFRAGEIHTGLLGAMAPQPAAAMAR